MPSTFSVKSKIAGTRNAIITINSKLDKAPAASLLKICFLYLSPPRNRARPSTSNILAIIEPVMEAFTTSILPERKAKKAMINSVALPNVALSRPPMVGPVFTARFSVASPIMAAMGIIERAAAVKITQSAGCTKNSRPAVIGTNTSNHFNIIYPL